MKSNKGRILIGICVGILAFAIVFTSVYLVIRKHTYDKFKDEIADSVDVQSDDSDSMKTKTKKDKADKVDDSFETKLIENTAAERKDIKIKAINNNSVDACVPKYQTMADLSNITNADRFYFSDDMVNKLALNNFVVAENRFSEFFDIYEENRYLMIPNFITTDSILHTYHLYFAKLQKNCEKQYLEASVSNMCASMLDNSLKQYEALKGTQWENAAETNVAFFAVGASLAGLQTEIPDHIKAVVDIEVENINKADGILDSPLFGEYEDYSQYIPRGYYEGDEQLERYFKTMMWFGRRNFTQKDEELNRSALLMTLAMDNSVLDDWQRVYSVTSFFAGESDDAGYYQYQPIILEAYGENVTYNALINDTNAFEKYKELTGKLEPPKINSMVYDNQDPEADRLEQGLGYRFMGQRFTLDEAIFTQLCYNKVLEDSYGNKRLLPDALDVPAAMGSDTALDILLEADNGDYKNYSLNMDALRKTIADNKSDSYSSLYEGWMNTLNPLLEKRGEGYPSFMTGEEWNKKKLECYLGSWTELKHDTVLYSKQFVAEMGGGDMDILDDRGYVEPEPQLYRSLSQLSTDTAEGLKQFAAIDDEDYKKMLELAEICDSLADISEKELRNETLTNEEYEFIRIYGGNLEHFWKDSLDKSEEEYLNPDEYPAALVVDVATDPNGRVLEEAIGGISSIYVVFPIDGELHIAKGGVFTYYQFEVPISERMTDSTWRRKLGMELDDNMEYVEPEKIDNPYWTTSYRSSYSW